MSKYWLRFLVWFYCKPGRYSSLIGKDYCHYQELKERLADE